MRFALSSLKLLSCQEGRRLTEEAREEAARLREESKRAEGELQASRSLVARLEGEVRAGEREREGMQASAGERAGELRSLQAQLLEARQKVITLQASQGARVAR